MNRARVAVAGVLFAVSAAITISSETVRADLGGHLAGAVCLAATAFLLFWWVTPFKGTRRQRAKYDARSILRRVADKPRPFGWILACVFVTAASIVDLATGSQRADVSLALEFAYLASLSGFTWWVD